MNDRGATGKKQPGCEPASEPHVLKIAFVDGVWVVDKGAAKETGHFISPLVDKARLAAVIGKYIPKRTVNSTFCVI